MRVLGFEISRVKKESSLERFVRLADELTDAWEDSYYDRNNVTPWIDWKEKVVFVAERKIGEPVKLEDARKTAAAAA